MPGIGQEGFVDQIVALGIAERETDENIASQNMTRCNFV